MTASGRQTSDSLLIAALATGAPYHEAAKRARVSERTARRRMEDIAFRRAVVEARSELVGRALGRASDAMVEAIDTHVELMRSAKSDGVRLSAARSLLQFAADRAPDPFSGSIRAATTIPEADFRWYTKKIVAAALDRISDDALQAAFLQDLDGLAAA